MDTITDGVTQSAITNLDQEHITEWFPARLISEGTGQSGYALLVLNQPLKNIGLLKLAWRKAGYRIAADGGGNRLYRVAQQDPEFAELVKSVPLNAVHGDLDSLSDAAKAWAESFGAKVERDPSEDTTDFTKCINYISKDYKVNRPARGAPDILAFGGLGGRVDQAISVLHHLYVSPSVYPKGQIYLTTTSSISFLLKTGTHRIIVRDPEAPDVLGVHIGILPLNGSSKITTKGLRWDVEDWETSMTTKMSTSNMVREEEVEVKTEGDVLFTIDFPNKEEVDV